LDIVQAKGGYDQFRKSPVSDPEIEEYLATRPLDLKATADPVELSGIGFMYI
jgi:UDPglucose 6-dehydrogenase